MTTVSEAIPPLPLDRLPADVTAAKSFRPSDAVNRRIGAALIFQ